MSLIKCPECDKEISSSIEKCIHCGYELRKENKVKGGKVIIHSYNESFAVNPSVKVYINDNFITEINKGTTKTLEIENDATLTFKSSIRSTNVNVSCDRTTEIQLSFDRGTGALKAITNVQGNDVSTNETNERVYKETVEKQNNSNNIWLIIGIICLILGLLLF